MSAPGEHVSTPEGLLEALECLDELAEFMMAAIPQGDVPDELALSTAIAVFKAKHGRRPRPLGAWIDRALRGHRRAGRPRKLLNASDIAQGKPESSPQEPARV